MCKLTSLHIKLINMMEAWTNPFSYSEQNVIVNLASGLMVTEDLQQDLLNAYTIGETSLNTFIEKRLENANIPFHDAIPRLKLKVFSELSSPP